MATYSHVKKGASGSAVSELQRLLNENGYTLDVDGNFGAKTQAAVRDYQQKNSLTVDGIVGNQTWSSLFSNKKSAPDSGTANYLAGYDRYTPSQAVNDAAATLAQYEAGRPGAYQSNYAAQIQGVLDKIMNREAFSYDFATDPLYQQYADKYQQQGKLAMMDTMGQAAALTGGYGNSYAQNVGQQAYQAHLQNLNDVIPELRNAAYQMYQDEGQEMYNQMALLQGLEDTDYGRYRDTVGDWYADRDYYYGKYNDLNEFGYNQFVNDRDYQLALQQAAQEQARWEAEFNLAKSKSGSSGKGGSSSKGSKESGMKLGVAAQSVYDNMAATGPSLGIEKQLERGVNNGTITEEEADYLLQLLGY